MLTDLDNSIIGSLKALQTLLPVDVVLDRLEPMQKLEIATEGAKLMLKMKEKTDGTDAPVSDEFYLEFSKNTPAVMREMFLFGGLNYLSRMLQSLE